MLFRKRVDDSKQKGVAKELEALGVEVDFMGATNRNVEKRLGSIDLLVPEWKHEGALNICLYAPAPF